MRARRRIEAIALIVLGAAGAPPLARADSERVHIQFEAPKGCQNETAFLRALRKRTTRFQGVSDREPARRFVATIVQRKTGVSGRLEIRGPGTAVSVRDVTGETCDEVMAALAFMAALAIDPDAALGPDALAPDALAPSQPGTPHALAAPGPEPTRAAMTPPSSGSAVMRRDDSDPPLATRAPSTATPAAVPQSSAPTPTDWRWAAGAQGTVMSGVSPTAGLGASLFVEVAGTGPSVSTPGLRTGLFLIQSDMTLASGAAARFRWVAGMVEGCPIRITVAASRLAITPCLAFHVGVLRSEGQNLDRPRATRAVWSDLGPVARVQLALTKRLSVEAQGMLVFPLRRLSYDVQYAGPDQPATTVFSCPWLGALAGIGVAYAF